MTNNQQLDTNQYLILRGIMCEINDKIDSLSLVQKKLDEQMKKLKPESFVIFKQQMIPQVPLQMQQQVQQQVSQQVPQQVPQPVSLVGVKSQTEAKKVYYIDINNGTCTCPHFIYKGPLWCKHMQDVVVKPQYYQLSLEKVNLLKTKHHQ